MCNLDFECERIRDGTIVYTFVMRESGEKFIKIYFCAAKYCDRNRTR